MNPIELSVSVSNFFPAKANRVLIQPVRIVSSTVAHARELVEVEGVPLSAVFFSVLQILTERYKGLNCSEWLASQTFRDVLRKGMPHANTPSGTKLRVTFDWAAQPIALGNLCVSTISLNLFVNEVTGEAEGQWHFAVVNAGEVEMHG